MSRPLRIQFEGAMYHVIARGNRRQLIFLDDADRLRWLGVLSDTCVRFGFVVHAYCMMNNHFHLLLQTPHAQLSEGMRHLNGVYSQAFNRKHELVGHLFQGRFSAFLCQRDAYFLELARYIVLNPVRARLVTSPEEWPWSSHRLVLGHECLPAWFDPTEILAFFGTDGQDAHRGYARFVEMMMTLDVPPPSPRHNLIHGCLELALTEEAAMKCLQDAEVPRIHKQAVVAPLEQLFLEAEDRNAAICAAFRSRAYTMSEIARHCGLSRRTIARVLARSGLFRA